MVSKSLYQEKIKEYEGVWATMQTYKDARDDNRLAAEVEESFLKNGIMGPGSDFNKALEGTIRALEGHHSKMGEELDRMRPIWRKRGSGLANLKRVNNITTKKRPRK